MVETIRRVVAWAIRQFVPPPGRHRRGAPSHSPAATPVAAPAASTWRIPRQPTHDPETLRAEENALVRPYVLTDEERVVQWRQLAQRREASCPHLIVTEAH
ncbi:hypothetical protein [Streptomyces sp. UNOB3_S3]|uniref:hypothetical protein n=1 Tax=Streptomyces sp. UNOB3_S3 TaxID=2871682 RepID=UPI001E571E4A|nr:hypothetical protein [Streptomyces sp. UNOB3_S3]MCC3774084.1 hypothetical protein [Streptomyces sp. UNOB3_S3]